MSARNLPLSLAIALLLPVTHASAAGGGMAAVNQELLDILLANGAINAEQHANLSRKAVLGAADVEEEVVVALDRKGLGIQSADGRFETRIGTRLHADAAAHSGSTGEPATADGTQLRRARIELKGRIEESWRWAAEVDLAGDAVAIKDFWLGYQSESGIRTMVGHQKQPYSLAVEMSSNDIAFMERGIDNDLIIPFVDRAIGLRVESNGDHWFAAAGVFGEAVSATTSDDEGWGVAGRFVYAPVIEDDRILHLGLRAAYREPNAGSQSARIRDETHHFSNLRIVDTGTLFGVESVTLYGPEAAATFGPVTISGEYNRAEFSRTGQSDLDFASWRVEAMWSLTGESLAPSYRIGSGEYKRLNGATPFDFAADRWGAWELALRYSSIDLNDGGVVGGEEDALTAALNWYVNTNIRLMFDVTHVLDTDGSSPIRSVAEGLDIYQMRAQYTF